MVSSPKLLINKLVLVGREKSYNVNFHSGLNIIHGDMDTGKSSILNLIDYLLGGSKVNMYDEIEQNGKYGLLEVELNGTIYTFKRDIFKTDENIEVYSTTIENMESIFPLEYAPKYTAKEGPAGYFSDFLLSNLNIPLVKVKKSPSKENSDMVRLSFRDIFKYCYFNQDEVGSKEILDRKNYALVAKNKETFKFLHNALDTQITELQNLIGEKNKEKAKLSNNYGVISSFLLETKLSTHESLMEQKSEVERRYSLINKEINRLTDLMKSDSTEIEELREIVTELDDDISNLNKKKLQKEMFLEQNLRLKKDYSSDLGKLQVSLSVKDKLPKITAASVMCPLCDSNLNIEESTRFFNNNNEEILKKEINSIKNRLKDIKLLIEEERDELFVLESKIKIKSEDLNRAREVLDTSSSNFISPYLSQRDMLIAEKSSLSEKFNKLDYFLKIRNQLNEIENNIITISDHLSELGIKLEFIKNSAPSIDKILDDIGSYLKEFLEAIPIKNPFGIRLSNKTFLPIVRERDYTDLTSGGLRTLVSVGYIVSLLKNSIYTNTNYPSFIMIDTIGKYLGKTKKDRLKLLLTGNDEDLKEDMEDPTKYVNLIKLLIDMSEGFLKNNKEHQIIVVENDFPEELEEKYQKYVVKRFSTNEREGYEIGFINNV
ncbi:hypothetical protein [Neobacillus soli]|uniref:hypothetical protein n=1 Tax=Neobacillus soli TaxID=220688 RepID=UPI000825CCEB|nr:hypothetical protein [Neobacillus soli]